MAEWSAQKKRSRHENQRQQFEWEAQPREQKTKTEQTLEDLSSRGIRQITGPLEQPLGKAGLPGGKAFIACGDQCNARSVSCAGARGRKDRAPKDTNKHQKKK